MLHLVRKPTVPTASSILGHYVLLWNIHMWNVLVMVEERYSVVILERDLNVLSFDEGESADCMRVL